jgi:REP element-mobilizing transposase RayT
MSHTYTSCLFHCVFSTSQRRNLIPRDIESRLWPYIGGIARDNAMRALAVGGIENHVHVLLSLPATMPISRSLQLIKGGSSRWMHETFPAMRDFAWQEGYGAFSIGTSQCETTVRYINKQREHHQRLTFEEEFAAFLKKHNMEYDERYVFG